MIPLWVIGSSGHAKVVIDTIRAAGQFEVVGVLDDQPDQRGKRVLGVQVHSDASIDSMRRLGVENAIIAVGSNRIRADISQRLYDKFNWATIIHPTAYLAEGVEIGQGTIVMAGAIIQPDSIIGSHVIINTGASIDHDGVVGDFVHVAPGVRLAGNVRVETGALLGIGCCALPGRTVGAWSTIGAGAVVARNVPPRITAFGVPAIPRQDQTSPDHQTRF